MGSLTTPAAVAPEPASASPARAARIPELDGLRGVAILVVLLYHLTGKLAGAVYFLQKPFQMGWSGVDLFFVLSGFLIGGILLDARHSPRYFSTFYLRRVYRILPIYYVWISLFFVAVLAHRSLPDALGLSLRYIRYYPTYLVFLQNVVNVQLSQFGFAWLTPLWSLAVEEQFYLIAPAIIRRTTTKTLVALLSLTLVSSPLLRIILLQRGHISAMTAWMPSRADSLAMGVMLAIAWRDPKAREYMIRWRKYVLGALAALSPVLLVLAARFPDRSSVLMASWGFTAIGIFCACLIMAILTLPSGWIARTMRISFLQQLGNVSYCMYVVHVLVYFVVYLALQGLSPKAHGLGSLAISLLSAGMVWIIAQLSWKYFEKPLMRKGHTYRY